MSLKLHGARLAAAAAVLTALAAGAAPAQGATLDRTLSCVYPLIGPVAIGVTIDADFVSPVPKTAGLPEAPFKATVTDATAATVGLTNAIGAGGFEGSFTVGTSISGPPIGEATLPVPVRLPFPKTQAPPSGAPLVLTGTGSYPALSFPAEGTAEVRVPTFELHFRFTDGGGIGIPPGTAADDGDPTTLDIACLPAPGGSITLASIAVRDSPQTTTPPPDHAPQIITSLSPSNGPAAGGNTVTLRGSFWGIVGVRFGGVPAEILSQTAAEVVVRAPAGVAGATVDVSAGNLLSGSNNTQADDYTYDAAQVTTPPGPLKPYLGSLSSTEGPTEGGNEVTIRGVFAGIGSLDSVTFGTKTAEIVSSETLAIVVKVPPGTTNQTVDVVVHAATGDSENTERDDYTYRTVACVDCGWLSYDLAGTATLKTLVRGSLPLSGSLSDVLIDLEGGNLGARMALAPTSAKLVALGFLPVTAKVAFDPMIDARGTIKDSFLTLNAKTRIKLPKVTLFGLNLQLVSTCQTKQPSNLSLRSATAFSPTEGGTLSGTFAISDLTGCGALNGIVSSITAGKGNAIALKLTPKP